MFRKGIFVVLSSLALGSLSGASRAEAGEKTLEFQLFTKSIDPRKIEVPNVEGQYITQSTAFGIAVFKDGRVATKDFVYVADGNKGGVSQFGYSTYTFDEGSTLTLSWTAESKPNQPYHGEYKVLSGTGAYAGATGKGTFDPIPSQLKGVFALKVRLVVVTP